MPKKWERYLTFSIKFPIECCFYIIYLQSVSSPKVILGQDTGRISAERIKWQTPRDPVQLQHALSGRLKFEVA